MTVHDHIERRMSKSYREIDGVRFDQWRAETDYDWKAVWPLRDAYLTWWAEQQVRRLARVRFT